MKQCPKCGASADDGARFCPACGAGMEATAAGTGEKATGGPAAGRPAQDGTATDLPSPPPKYLPWSIVLLIVSTVCLCNPISLVLSIIALVFGTQIDELARIGRMEEANSKSKNARIMLIVATVLDVLWFAGCMVFYGVYTYMQLKGQKLF